VNVLYRGPAGGRGLFVQFFWLLHSSLRRVFHHLFFVPAGRMYDRGGGWFEKTSKEILPSGAEHATP